MGGLLLYNNSGFSAKQLSLHGNLTALVVSARIGTLQLTFALYKVRAWQPVIERFN